MTAEKKKEAVNGCYYNESKKIPSTDKTYCHGIACDKFKKCSRYIGNYEFDKDRYYSFIFNCNDRLFKKKEVEK